MKITKDDYIKRSAARHAVLHNTGDAARAAIDSIPPEDVVPVVHAANITDENPVDQLVCSHCEIIVEGYIRKVIDEDDGAELFFEYQPRFCPNCGAKLDIDADDLCIGRIGLEAANDGYGK